MTTAATVLLSGGIDSAACAHLLKVDGKSVRAVFVDYGQISATPEKASAIAISQSIEIPLEIISAHAPLSFGTGEIKGRNAFLVLSALCLCRTKKGLIALGIHSGTRYYDCSPAFCSLIDRVVAEYTDGLVRVVAPFIGWSKGDVVDYFRKAGLPFESTYSCEGGTIPPCGRCLSCQDRKIIGC